MYFKASGSSIKQEIQNFKKQESVSERVKVALHASLQKSFSVSNEIDSVFDKDNSTNAGILWTLKIIMNHFSFLILHGLR